MAVDDEFDDALMSKHGFDRLEDMEDDALVDLRTIMLAFNDAVEAMMPMVDLAQIKIEGSTMWRLGQCRDQIMRTLKEAPWEKSMKATYETSSAITVHLDRLGYMHLFDLVAPTEESLSKCILGQVKRGIERQERQERQERK